MTRIVIGLFVASLLSLGANARVIEFGETETYTFQKVPYKKCWSQESEFQQIIKVSLDKYLERVEKTGHISIFTMDMSNESLHRIRAAAKKVRDNLDVANEYTKYILENHRPELDVADALPDAMVVFLGGKLGMSLGIGAGTTLMAGAVIMPYCLTKVMKESGEVVKTWDIDVDYVAWGGPNFGAGIGGGPRARFGLGLIWSLSGDFDDPGQFSGGYAGVSTTMTLGLGVNFKTGVVKSASTNVLDFAYASAAVEIGAAAEVSWHKNFYAIVPASELLSTLGGAYTQQYQKDRAQLKDAIRDAVRDVVIEEREQNVSPAPQTEEQPIIFP